MPSLFQKIQSKYFRKSVLNLIQFKPAANVNFVAEHMMNSHNTTSFINRVINDNTELEVPEKTTALVQNNDSVQAYN